LITRVLDATIGPDIDPVRKLNVAVSCPSVTVSLAIVLEKDAELLTVVTDPVNNPSEKSAVVIPVPLVVQYSVVLFGTLLTVIVNTTVFPSLRVTLAGLM
jgi:hypothetical protein